MMQAIDSKINPRRPQDYKSVDHLSKNAETSIPKGARLLSLQQAAEYTGLSYWTLRDYVADGVLPRVILPCGRQRTRNGILTRKAGDSSNRKILIDREDLDRLIAQSKVNVG